MGGLKPGTVKASCRHDAQPTELNKNHLITATEILKNTLVGVPKEKGSPKDKEGCVRGREASDDHEERAGDHGSAGILFPGQAPGLPC